MAAALGGTALVIEHAVHRKGKLSVIAYVVGIGASFTVHWLPQTIYTAVALAWLIPDRRIERTVEAKRS